MATIKDVALEAGVSVTTASYSLNNQGRISNKTRSEVLKAARKLGYSPSLSARALRGCGIKAVGIFVDGIAGPVYGAIIEGAQEQFKAEGWGLVVSTLNDPGQEIARSMVEESWLAGSVLLNGGLAPEYLRKTLYEKAPLVIMDIEPEFLKEIPYDSDCCRIEIDNQSGMELIFNTILRLNRKYILYLEGPLSSWDSVSRKNTFTELCRLRDIPVLHFLTCNYNAMEAYHKVFSLLHDDFPYDCIVSSNDEMAIGAMKALKEHGIGIPDDIIITGFDNIESSHWINPSLTTVEVDYHQLGRRIGEEILDLITKRKQVRKNITFPVTLVERETTGL